MPVLMQIIKHVFYLPRNTQKNKSLLVERANPVGGDVLQLFQPTA